MSIESRVIELKNGYQVPLDTFNSLCKAAEALLEKNDIYTLHSLAKKCQDTSFKLIPSQYGDASLTLKQYHLLDENDNVNEDIRQIVLSGIEESGNEMRISVPLSNDDIVTITITKTNHL